MRQIFITNDDEYWCVYDDIDSGYQGIYYKFHENGVYDRYRIEKGVAYVNNNAPDNYPGIKKWEVRKDSIAILNNHTFDIVSYNQNVIILSKYERHIFLIKENSKSVRKGGKFFYNKREDNPEKY